MKIKPKVKRKEMNCEKKAMIKIAKSVHKIIDFDQRKNIKIYSSKTNLSILSKLF